MMKPAIVTTTLATCITALLASSVVMGGGQVGSVLLTEQPATPFDYSANGIDYQWGRGNNQLIEGVVVQGRNYSFAVSADEVVVRRDDIAGVASGEPCGIFVERVSQDRNTRSFAADFPADNSGNGNCSLESLLESRVLNRGVVDVFSNTRPDAKNIERLDYLFFYGALAPIEADQLQMAGHLVAEKQGNNAVKIASILALDVFGQPAEYGPLVSISPTGCSGSQLCYGNTDLVHTYSFLQNEFDSPQGLPVETEQSIESVAMALVSAADLGLNPGQRYFGFSIFADDVDEQQHDLLDPGTFPNDTSDDDIVIGDDADIYGGLAGYYFADDLAVIDGRLFLDVDLDGVSDANEAGISDISLALYSDVNGNGILDSDTDVQLGDTIISNIDGEFHFPGISDGNYIVVLDETDPQIPGGLVVAPGINPFPLVVTGGMSDPVYFSFISDSGSGSGSGNDDQGNGGDGSDGDAGDGLDDGSDGDAGDAGDGSDGNAGDGSDGDAGDGSDGNAGDGSDGDAGDGSDGDAGDGSDGDAGDGSDGNAGDGSDGNAGDGSDGNAGDGLNDGAGDGTGDGAGDGTDDGAGDGTGDISDDGAPMLDEVSAAISDEFEVNQGSSIMVDVLANDAGTGLRLLSVTQTANATISISDDGLSVLYVPNPGYFSPEGEPDTFMYTMAGDDGIERTGNVSATVIRFSDLNNNLVNDFVECDCTELFLVTGVDGTGIGHISKYILLLLGLIAFGRLVHIPMNTRATMTRGN